MTKWVQRGSLLLWILNLVAFIYCFEDRLLTTLLIVSLCSVFTTAIAIYLIYREIDKEMQGISPHKATFLFSFVWMIVQMISILIVVNGL